MTDTEQPDYTVLTVQLLSAYVTNNMVPSSELAALIQSTRAALVEQTAAPGVEQAPEYVPAVSVRKSIASREHIISLIDGRPYKTLKRHLASHGLTPAQYRERYSLSPSYPMVAPGYSEQRREVAQRLGLGQRGAAAKGAAASTDAPTPATSAPVTADASTEKTSMPAARKGRRQVSAPIPKDPAAAVATDKRKARSKASAAPTGKADDKGTPANPPIGIEQAAVAAPIVTPAPKTARKAKPAAPSTTPATQTAVKPVQKVSRKTKAVATALPAEDAGAPAAADKASKPVKAKAPSRGAAKKAVAGSTSKAPRLANTPKSPRKTLGIKTPDAQPAAE